MRTDSLMIGNIRVSSLLSAILCITCVAVLVLLKKRGVGEKPEEYQPQFAAVNEMSLESIGAKEEKEDKTEVEVSVEDSEDIKGEQENADN